MLLRRCTFELSASLGWSDEIDIPASVAVMSSSRSNACSTGYLDFFHWRDDQYSHSTDVLRHTRIGASVQVEGIVCILVVDFGVIPSGIFNQYHSLILRRSWYWIHVHRGSARSVLLLSA